MNAFNHPTLLRETIRLLERKLGVLEECQLACCGITLAQCHALVEIGRAGSISLNELAKLLDLENSSMSRTINTLVTKSLVLRTIDPQDRRYVKIALTESGKSVFMEIEESMNAYFKKIYDLLPHNKRDQIIDSLQILLSVISENN